MGRKLHLKRRIQIGNKVFDVVNIIFLLLFTIMCFYPFYLILICSVSDNSLVNAGQIRLLPRGIHLENYVSIFELNNLGSAAVVSLLRTVLGTLVMLMATSVLGYAMTRKEYWHRKFWYRFTIVTMYFGAGIIPTYMNFKRLGLLGSFLVYIIPAACSPYNMILVKTYMENIPDSLEEAAVVDGAGYLKRFWRIILPLSKPILATVSIFTAVSQWNSYMDTVLYMTKGQYQTLQSILYRYLNQANMLASAAKSGQQLTENLARQLNPASIRYTITAVTVLPILLVYPFFQRYFTEGIMIGAVKG